MRRKSYINLAKKLKSPPVLQVISTELPEKKDPIQSRKNKDENKKSLSKALRHFNKMSNEELEMLMLSDDDNFIIDCFVDQCPQLRKLEQERDDLQRQVTNLANFNYAREPEFVRDRLKLRETLDEVNALRRRVSSKHLQPIVEKLNKTQSQLSAEARKYEEESESMAQEFLDGKKSYDDFVEEYIKLRHQTSQKRILADKLAKEKTKLSEDIPRPFGTNSPTPAPRHRKRVSFNQ